jgi:uncharacterized protein YndB with AHSA1/START domain
MSANQFHLTTHWSIPAPPAAVWYALLSPEEWPTWWRAVKHVETLAAGDTGGIGAVRRFIWRTALPYTLTFDMRVTRLEPMTLIEGRAEGELTGFGRWTLAPEGARRAEEHDASEHTSVHYEWTVEVTQPWMRALAPLARPVFAWNHGVVMRWGLEGLTRKLAALPYSSGSVVKNSG